MRAERCACRGVACEVDDVVRRADVDVGIDINVDNDIVVVVVGSGGGGDGDGGGGGDGGLRQRLEGRATAS